MEEAIEKPEIILNLQDESQTAVKDFSKTACPKCGHAAKWQYLAWDLDQHQNLVHFGHYVYPKCNWKSNLRTRKFKFPDQMKRFGLE